MPVVTGNLTDIGLGHLTGFNPEIIFTLNAPNVAKAGGKIYPTRSEVAKVSESGAFSLTLADTTGMRNEAWYTMRVRWGEPGASNASGYTALDVLDAQVTVPGWGGSVSDLFSGSPSGFGYVYVSLTQPRAPRRFSYWLEQDPGDVNNPKNTGKLYGWRNA